MRSHEFIIESANKDNNVHKPTKTQDSIVESFDLVETAALIETAMDTITHPRYGKIWWINHGGSHIIATKKPNGSLDIHALGTHKEIAAKWANLKSKIHTGSQEIKDSMQESATAGATSSGNIASVPNPHLTVGKTNKSYTGSPGVSGTKRPKQPKVKMQSPGTNALDMKTNIFGAGPIKR